jgi:hypothetical protein
MPGSKRPSELAVCFDRIDARPEPAISHSATTPMHNNRNRQQGDGGILFGFFSLYEENA